MSEWGFSSIESRQSNPDRLDLSLIKAVGRIEPSIYWCIGCGSCTAACTSSQFNGFNPRKIFQSIMSGYTKEISEEITKCLLCGKCQFVCPRNVNTRNILSNIQLIVGRNEL